MRFIDLTLIDPNDPEVVKWNKKATKHKNALLGCQTLEAKKKYLGTKKNQHWRNFKKILEKYFGDKCWYTEKRFNTSPGDVDHFRPKNASTDENGNTLTDGYWWLAYDYNNYRYSCENSNRLYKKGGKNDCFPLKQGTAPSSCPKSDDKNVLLDPCNEDDCNLICCNEAGCVVTSSSDKYDKKRVETSVKVYNLNLFNEDRRSLRLKCEELLKRYAFFRDKSIVDSKESFSSFLRKFIREEIKDKDYAPKIEKLLQNTP